MATVEAGVARRGLTGRDPAAPSPAPATFVTITGAGDHYWRAEAPARVLGARMVPVPEKEAGDAFLGPNFSTAFPWALDVMLADGGRTRVTSKESWDKLAKGRSRYLDVTADFPTIEGTVVWTRPDPARAALTLALQEQGVRCLAETDDNYFADPNHNLFLRQNRFGDAERMAHARAFCLMDGIVFSTTALRDLYAKELRDRVGKRNVPELFVARNHVPRSDWPERVERDGPLRVGFMGSSSHVWDVQLAYHAFATAAAAGCETVMIGYSPANPDPDLPDVLDDGTTWRTDKSMEHKRLWGDVVTKHIRWIEPDAYHRAALPLDIGIAPLRWDSFTRGKSSVKAIEYAISGAACVLSSNPVYTSDGWKNEVNCLTAGSPREYAEQVMRLIKDDGLRYELVTAAQEMVATERGDEAIVREWTEALDG